VGVVLAVKVLLFKVMVKVSDDGLVEEPYVTLPALLVISTRESALYVDEARVTVTDCITSVPEDVLKVKVSEVVAVPLGAKEIDGVSVPVVRVTIVDPGETGLGRRSAP
jgi:hypothetical protein